MYNKNKDSFWSFRKDQKVKFSNISLVLSSKEIDVESLFSCEATPYLLECVHGCVGGMSQVFKASHWPNSKLKD